MEPQGEGRSRERFLRPERAELRRRGGRPRLPRRVLLAGVALLVLASAAWLLRLLGGSRGLVVTSIEFIGRERSPERALGSVSRELIGRSLLRLDLDRIESRLKAASPWVRSASVRRLLSGRLEITLVEHHPVAAIAPQGAELLAPGGERLPGHPARPGDEHLPLVVLAAGAEGGKSAARAAELLALLGGGEAPLLERLASIDASRSGDLELRLKDRPWSLRLGGADLAAQLNRYRNAEPILLARYQGLEQVDVRFRDRVVVAPVKPAASHPATSGG